MKSKTQTITDPNSREAQKLFRGFAVRIREFMMKDAAKQFGKLAGSIPKMKDGQTRTFQTKPLSISVTKKFLADHKFNIRISVSS